MRDRSHYIAATDDVLRVVSERMREEDVREAAALGFSDPLAALIYSRDASTLCHAAVSYDEDATVLGVGGLITREEFGSVGIPWAILTAEGTRRKRWVVREARYWIGLWRERYELRNGVHALNMRGRALIEILGFEIADEPYRHEETGAEFLLFSMPRAKNVEVPLCASS